MIGLEWTLRSSCVGRFANRPYKRVERWHASQRRLHHTVRLDALKSPCVTSVSNGRLTYGYDQKLARRIPLEKRKPHLQILVAFFGTSTCSHSQTDASTSQLRGDITHTVINRAQRIVRVILQAEESRWAQT